MVDYEKLKKSLKHLENQYRNYQSADSREELFQIDKDAIAESVVQRFETCYDSLWKTLKRYIAEELGLPDLPNSPKPVFRIAAENQLFPDVEKWLSYADARVGTAHDYSEPKAREALALMKQFIADATVLYSKMTGTQWQ